jgi:hypothetical protein
MHERHTRAESTRSEVRMFLPDLSAPVRVLVEVAGRSHTRLHNSGFFPRVSPWVKNPG